MERTASLNLSPILQPKNQIPDSLVDLHQPGFPSSLISG